MPSPLPQLTTLLLLIHLGFGCCLHHAHACETNCCFEPTPTAAGCPCGAHRHDGADDAAIGVGNSPNDGEHHQRHHCAGEDCTFVPSQSASEAVDEFAACLSALELFGAECNVDLFRSHLGCKLDRLDSHGRHSLRSHLALRVLLI